MVVAGLTCRRARNLEAPAVDTGHAMSSPASLGLALTLTHSTFDPVYHVRNTSPIVHYTKPAVFLIEVAMV